MKIRYSYHQRAVVCCEGTLEVPAEIIALGDHAVHEFIRENEPDANDVSDHVIDYHDEVLGTMEFEDVC
jgi:hypothetical protein